MRPSRARRSGHDAGTGQDTGVKQAHTEANRRNYLIRFEEDTLRERPLWIRLIIEFTGTAGPCLGAVLAVALIALVRGLAGSKERGAAEGDALPL